MMIRVNCRKKTLWLIFALLCTLNILLICYSSMRMKMKAITRTQMRNILYNPRTPYEANFTHRELKRIPGLGNNIQLFSAIVGNSTTADSPWDRISINGWDFKNKRNIVRFCCCSYSSGLVKSFPVINKEVYFKSGVNFACKIINGGNVTKASLSKAKGCQTKNPDYVSVEHSFNHSKEIAVFAKVIYGNISAINLITWFEVHKLFGFHKVYMYPYDDLNSKMMRVLQFYINQGLLEAIPYTTPQSESLGSKGYFSNKNDSAWANKQPSLYDGFARLKGYKYVMCFDPDEYIIPKKEKSYMELFDRLFKEHPDAAGFYFQTYLYIKDWNATNLMTSFDIGWYQMRTKLLRDRVKHVYIPGRLASNRGFQVHELFVKKGYKTYDLPEEEAAIHHYRGCRAEFLGPNAKFPCYKVKRYHDVTMNTYLQRVNDKVFEVAEKLGIEILAKTFIP